MSAGRVMALFTNLRETLNVTLAWPHGTGWVFV